jgi:hypothetical protein
VIVVDTTDRDYLKTDIISKLTPKL